jgi:CheY-like chemotaxis protein
MFLANGFNDYLSKPINAQALDEILKKWMSSEKISPCVELIKDCDDIANDSFWNRVDKIEEINIKDALCHFSGNKDMFRNILNMFQKEIVSECNSMTDFLDARDIGNFSISVHAIKSILTMIGATDLSKMAKKLEHASKLMKVDDCIKKFPEFKKGILSLQKGLSDIFCTLEEEKEPGNVENKEGKENIKVGRALLVDDMDMILFVVKEKLSQYGLAVDTALSGHEAIEKIKCEKYDIVFMDHMMPDMDGIETTQKIRKLGPEYKKIPIIALTANTDSGIKEMFFKKGFNDFLLKPVITEKLEKILKNWMPS